MRRALWETVVDLVSGIHPMDDVEMLLRVTSLSLDVPIEVAVRQTAAGLEILADLPRWRWTTAFDDQRGRLKITCREGETL